MMAVAIARVRMPLKACNPLKYRVRTSAVANLANSLGWMRTGPSCNQFVLPPTSLPRTGTRASSRSDTE